MLQSVESQRVGHALATEVNRTEHIDIKSRKMVLLNYLQGGNR